MVSAFPCRSGACVALIALSALLNIVLRIRYPASHRLASGAALALLSYDVLQLGALLFATGGLDNPFCVLLLVPLIVSATTQGKRPTMALGILVVAVASVLALYHAPLPWRPGETLVIPLVYSAGAWVALVSACVFTGSYTFRVAQEARQLAKALTATELVLAREQHLSALDGLAAAAAHELGTPLATIALVAKELELDMPPGSPHRDDVLLLKSQVQRCRDILAKLASLSDEGDPLTRQPLSHLIDEVVDPFRAFTTEIAIAGPKSAGAEPVAGATRRSSMASPISSRTPSTSPANASRSAPNGTPRRVTVTIADDGPGFASAIIDRIGEPYVTTRTPSGDDRAHHEAGGLGLGVFIAKTLLERTGAKVSLANHESPESGAIVRVSWPRTAMDLAAAEIASPPEAPVPGTPWREPAETL